MCWTFPSRIITVRRRVFSFWGTGEAGNVFIIFYLMLSTGRSDPSIEYFLCGYLSEHNLHYSGLSWGFGRCFEDVIFISADEWVFSNIRSKYMTEGTFSQKICNSVLDILIRLVLWKETLAISLRTGCWWEMNYGALTSLKECPFLGAGEKGGTENIGCVSGYIGYISSLQTIWMKS